MPRGDGTGPQGLGPMTGRAAGYCAGYPVPGYMNPYEGRFFGAGRGYPGVFGRGRGFRNWYYATGLPGWYRYNLGMPAWGGTVREPYYPYYGPDVSKEQEKDMLRDQAEFLKQQLSDIEKRVEELEKEEGKEQ